jgi:hypothetical protein
VAPWGPRARRDRVRAHASAALRRQAGVPRPLQALARGGRRRARHRRLPQGDPPLLIPSSLITSRHSAVLLLDKRILFPVPVRDPNIHRPDWLNGEPHQHNTPFRKRSQQNQLTPATRTCLTEFQTHTKRALDRQHQFHLSSARAHSQSDFSFFGPCPYQQLLPTFARIKDESQHILMCLKSSMAL